MFFYFFFQAEDGIRDHCVTGVQTCALPISSRVNRREVLYLRTPGRPAKWNNRAQRSCGTKGTAGGRDHHHSLRIDERERGRTMESEDRLCRREEQVQTSHPCSPNACPPKKTGPLSPSNKQPEKLPLRHS